MASGGRIASGALTGAGSGAAIGTALGGPGIGTAIGAGAGILGGLLSGDDGSDQAREAIQKAIAQYDALGMPPDLSGPIIYQQLQAGGRLTPQMEGILNEELTNVSTVQDNPNTRNDLTSALSQIRAKTFGGLSPEQMANQQKLLQQVGAQTQSQIKGAQNTQAAQGKSGSGDALAAMLSAAQGGAQQGSQNALQIGAQGANAQDSALRDYLQGIGALRASDTGREQFNASAQNTANQYKLQNSASRQARNVASSNQGQEYNLNRQNQVNDYNTQMGNQELLREQEAKRQHWLDQLALAQGKANAYTGQAGMYTQMANNSNQNWNSMLQGAGTVAGGIAQGVNYNNRTNAMYPQTPPTQNQNSDVGVPRQLTYNYQTGQLE